MIEDKLWNPSLQLAQTTPSPNSDGCRILDSEAAPKPSGLDNRMLETSDMSGHCTPSLKLEWSDFTRIRFAPDAISMNCFSQAAAAKSQPAVRPLPEKNCCADTNTSGCSHRTEQKNRFHKKLPGTLVSAVLWYCRLRARPNPSGPLLSLLSC